MKQRDQSIGTGHNAATLKQWSATRYKQEEVEWRNIITQCRQTDQRGGWWLGTTWPHWSNGQSRVTNRRHEMTILYCINRRTNVIEGDWIQRDHTEAMVSHALQNIREWNDDLRLCQQTNQRDGWWLDTTLPHWCNGQSSVTKYTGMKWRS